MWLATATAMHLVQLLLPLRTPEGDPIESAHFRRLREEFTTRFGGVTVYGRAPAHGVWHDADEGTVAHDDVVVVEVMVEALDRAWWRRRREAWEVAFRQQEIVIRAWRLERL